MSKEVKCVLCNKPFKSKETLKKHYVEEHSVPRNDATLRSETFADQPNREIFQNIQNFAGINFRSQGNFKSFVRILAERTKKHETAKVSASESL